LIIFANIVFGINFALIRTNPLLKIGSAMKHFLFLLAFGAIPSASMASILEINLNIDRVQHNYNPNGGHEADSLVASNPEGYESFTARLSDYEALRITYSAPSGYRFHVAAPPHVRELNLKTSIFYDYSPGKITTWDVLPTTVTLGDLDGANYTASTVETRVFNGGEFFYVEGWTIFGRGAERSFDRIVFEASLESMDFRSDVERIYTTRGISPAFVIYKAYGDTADYGSVVTLVSAVPEPGSLALFFTALLGVFAFRKNSKVS